MTVLVNSSMKSGSRRDLCWNWVARLRLHEAIRSCGEVNDLIGWFLGEGLPSVDLAHGDLS